MKETEDIILYPVVGWEVRVLQKEQAVVVRLPFMSHSMQKMEESHPGRNYVFQPEQAKGLREKINLALQQLKSVGCQRGSGPQH